MKVSVGITIFVYETVLTRIARKIQIERKRNG